MAENKPRVRVKAGSTITKGEGDFRPGPWYLPISGGWLPSDIGANWNWWQNGFNLTGMNPSSVAEACVAAYAQTVAMCPGDHWRLNQETNGRTRVRNSALTRFLKIPNTYQTISDFLMNGVRNLYEDGNLFALILRNSRYEIDEMHLMNPRACNAYAAYDGSVYYSLGGNMILDRINTSTVMVPARDVMHIKLATHSYNPLRGVSPIEAAARDMAANDAMLSQQLAFYLNQARPSTVLSTDLVLDKDQVTQIRDRWNEQSRGLGAGGTPILTGGLKPLPMSQNAVDSQLIDMMRMTEQHVALAFRVPMQILGISSSGTSTGVGTTETLMQGWLAGALGFCLNHVEMSFDRAFGLAGFPDEYLELNTSVLLRSAFKDRMEGLSRGVQGGIIAPDEARETEGYPKVEGGFGEEPRVQSQVVPLSAAGAIPVAPASPSAPAAAAVAAPKGISNGERDRFKRISRSSHERQLI